MPSSVIRVFHYDPSDRRLDILFVSRRLYSYYDVPPGIALGMRGAPSKGEYFNNHIRDRYRFTRTRGKSQLPSRRPGDDYRAASQLNAGQLVLTLAQASISA